MSADASVMASGPGDGVTSVDLVASAGPCALSGSPAAGPSDGSPERGGEASQDLPPLPFPDPLPLLSLPIFRFLQSLLLCEPRQY